MNPHRFAPTTSIACSMLSKSARQEAQPNGLFPHACFPPEDSRTAMAGRSRQSISHRSAASINLAPWPASGMFRSAKYRSILAARSSGITGRLGLESLATGATAGLELATKTAKAIKSGRISQPACFGRNLKIFLPLLSLLDQPSLFQVACYRIPHRVYDWNQNYPARIVL